MSKNENAILNRLRLRVSREISKICFNNDEEKACVLYDIDCHILQAFDELHEFYFLSEKKEEKK